MRTHMNRRFSGRNALAFLRSGTAALLAGPALWVPFLLFAPLPGQSAQETRPLQPGEMAPSGIRFQTLDGGTFELSRLISDSPVALVFFRGGW